MTLGMRASRDVPDSGVMLCVGLTGTVLKGDCLGDVLLQLLQQRPGSLLKLPIWAFLGRRNFEKEVVARVRFDASRLAYNQPVVRQLGSLAKKRQLVLCTGTDSQLATVIAEHLGFFHRVIGSSGRRTLRGTYKHDVLCQQFGATGFEYVGNERGDPPDHSLAVQELAEGRRTTWRSTMWAWLRAIRFEQWTKNLLVFLPLLAAHQFLNWQAWQQAALAFISFSLCASSHYIVNDLSDLYADRSHPRKRGRMFASGMVSVWAGMLASPALLLVSVAIALQLGSLFVALLAGYYLATTLYTFWFKRIPLLDVLILAGLYTLRILAGAAAVRVVPSFWLLAFSMFFFLSLALAKRHSEMSELNLAGEKDFIPGRGYRAEDKVTLISQGAASGYAAILVLAFYINSEEVTVQYSQPEVIWLICPLLLYWVNKLWLNSQRREILEDPVVWALTNRVSRAILVLCGLLILAAI